MTLQLLFLTSTLCFGLGLPPVSDMTSSAARDSVVNDDDSDATDISGAYRWVGEDDNWVYFSLNGVGIAMKKAAFPNPGPNAGQQMTATGCVPDPGWAGGFICTGLN